MIPAVLDAAAGMHAGEAKRPSPFGGRVTPGIVASVAAA
jgi:hypothetical protein